MEIFGDKQRVDQCIVLAVGIKQLMELTGPVTHPAAIAYRERAAEFFFDTLAAADLLSHKNSLHLVE